MVIFPLTESTMLEGLADPRVVFEEKEAAAAVVKRRFHFPGRGERREGEGK